MPIIPPASPVSPLPSPAGILFPRTFQTLPPYSASAASGTMYVKTQYWQFTYWMMDWVTPGTVGGLLHQCTIQPQLPCPNTTRIMALQGLWAVDEVLQDWNPAGFSGCPSGWSAPSSTSATGPFVAGGCTGLSSFNSFQCMSAILSSTSSQNGLGTQGILYTIGGRLTRAATPLDSPTHEMKNYVFGYITLRNPGGQWDEYADDPSVAQNFMPLINTMCHQGGLGDWYTTEELGTPTPSMELTEGIESWEEGWLCSGASATITTTTSITSTTFITTTTTTPTTSTTTTPTTSTTTTPTTTTTTSTLTVATTTTTTPTTTTTTTPTTTTTTSETTTSTTSTTSTTTTTS